MIKEELIKEILIQVIKIRNKFGHYPPKIELCKEEYEILLGYKPIMADPNWHISICGSRIICYNG